jgi:hypothetical protein
MALQENRPLNERYLAFSITDVSSSSTSQLVPVPFRGHLVRVVTCQSAAITSANAVLTPKKNGTTVGTDLTIVVADSAIGSVHSVELAPGAANSFVEGDYLSVSTDGGSSTTSIATGIAVFRDA